jgi:hypothetical protein
MLTARPKPALGREAGLAPRPAGGVAVLQAWSHSFSIPSTLRPAGPTIPARLLTPPNPQFVYVRWSFPTSGKVTAKGAPPKRPLSASNLAQLPEIRDMVLPLPPTPPSCPFLCSLISPGSSLHPSLPAQLAPTTLPTLLPSIPPPRPYAGPRLGPGETLGLSRIELQ